MVRMQLGGPIIGGRRGATGARGRPAVHVGPRAKGPLVAKDELGERGSAIGRQTQTGARWPVLVIVAGVTVDWLEKAKDF